MATITDRYDDAASFTGMLTRIGLPNRERNRLNTDGFTTMKLMVNHYTTDVEDLRKYLKELNKTYGTAAGNLRCNFNPFIISRLIGVTHYFNFCVKSLHVIPDIDLVDLDESDTLGSFYTSEFKEISNSDDNEEDFEVKVPELTDPTKWLKFRDSLIERLGKMTGARGIPIDYVINFTTRQVTNQNSQLVEINDIVDISDIATYSTRVVHFGPAYKKDSKTVWEILKGLMLNTTSWYHISSYDTSKKKWTKSF